LTVWRSPDDQPCWARPILLGVAAAAAFTYSWGIGNVALEPLYGAAARSMAGSWKGFFFGAVDPYGTVTLDKMPGAIWLQALSVRIFGFHYWAVGLPQVIVGVLTVLVLYRVVRVVAGAVAGLAAAVALAVSPSTTLLDRGNISDSVMILLLVLAADATIRAIVRGRLRPLVLAGVWVGLAFQAKMVQAWLVLPALGLAYLVAATPRMRRRLMHVALLGIVTVVVSLSWMTAVSLVPGHDRPYVDGTLNDSEFTQVFVYNGWARLGIKAGTSDIPHGAQPFITARGDFFNASTLGMHRSLLRLIRAPFGLDDGWLLPLALLAAIGLLVAARRSPRGDPMRAGALLWLGWLVVHLGFFSAGRSINIYYTAALAPAVAALVGIGCGRLWDARARSSTPVLVAIGAVATTWACGQALYTEAASPPGWVWPAALIAAAMALIALVAALRGSPAGRLRPIALAVGAVAIVFSPAVASAVSVSRDLGSFATPYQSAEQTVVTSRDAQRFQNRSGGERQVLDEHFPGHGVVATYDTSSMTAGEIMVSGREFLPIGGYLGGNPSPTLAQLKHDISDHEVGLVLVPILPASTDPRLAWIVEHCDGEQVEPDGPHVQMQWYVCTPLDV
jgi:4-amino-4-deoxy-L-arabinose transferase-like glycosyltransferase